MSQNDSFIEEVTEDLRRDRLFALMRRYGWVAIAAVIAVVGAASWNEYRKSAERAEAQALGDALIAAQAAAGPEARAAALESVTAANGPAAAVVGLMRAGALAEAGEQAAAADLLDTIASEPDLAPRWRDLAALRALALRAANMSAEARLAALAPLVQPGAPYRALALEQRALAEIDAGQRTAAIASLRDILVTDAATEALRLRARQLLVALDADAAAS